MSTPMKKFSVRLTEEQWAGLEALGMQEGSLSGAIRATIDQFLERQAEARKLQETVVIGFVRLGSVYRVEVKRVVLDEVYRLIDIGEGLNAVRHLHQTTPDNDGGPMGLFVAKQITDVVRGWSPNLADLPEEEGNN